MALETLVSGRYSSTYNAVDTGVSEGGYELDQGASGETIDETDAFGGSVIDFIYRGGQVYMDFRSIAYKAGSVTPFWPWGALGVMLTAAAPLGRLASDVAMAHVLTSVANTPAAAAPATLTASKAILPPNYSAKLLYNSKLRTVPVRLLYLPVAVSTDIKWFTQT